MVDLSEILGGLNVALTLQERRERRQLEQQMENGEVDTQQLPFDERRRQRIAEKQSETAQRLSQLIDIESRRGPTPGDRDAFSTAVIDLNPGETAVVTIEPVSGFNLRVKRIHFDRLNDHDYEINVAGDITSVAHRAVYTKPKLVSQSDRVTAEVTNNAGTGSVVDFELEAWAEQPGGGY